jgi:ABC-type multidrug transport system ATPase subunit
MSGFATISLKVKELFRMISMGGDAELEIVDCFDPFASGIEFTVRPARKTWKQISYLSGGEKTLSSLALVFALHYFKPSPFYVMDEIDAALDFKNVSIIANYIKERTKNTQFIIISLRSNMFELADSLLGVYKVDNMSYSIHLGVGKLLEQLKKRFEENGKPFPLVSEYANSPSRRKALQRAASPELFATDLTAIPESESEDPIQTQTQTQTQGETQMETETPVQTQTQRPAARAEIRTQATQGSSENRVQFKTPAEIQSTQIQPVAPVQQDHHVVEADPVNQSIISTVSVSNSANSFASTSTRMSDPSASGLSDRSEPSEPELSSEPSFMSPADSPNISPSKATGEE